jgi:hypothetical protein
MFARSLYLFALGALVLLAMATEAAAGCWNCLVPCAPPQVLIWGLAPSYVVNQGPVYTGPGFVTWPIYEAEVSIFDYPYVGHDSYAPYRRYPYYRPYYHHGLEPRLGPRALTLSSADHGPPRGHRLYRDPRDR